MRRLIVIAVTLGGAVWSLSAQDVGGRKGLSDQEVKERQAVVVEHDADGDGVLSKSEQEGLNKAEKKALARTGGAGTARKAAPQARVKANKSRARIQVKVGGGPKAGKPNDPIKTSKVGTRGKGNGGNK